MATNTKRKLNQMMRINRKIRYFIFASIVVLHLPISAQNEAMLFSHVTVPDGLADGWVHDILMDSKGTIWLATHDGLSRYDGHHIKNYKVNKSVPHSLPGSTLMNIKEGENDIYWIACNGIGLLRFDARNQQFSSYTYDPENKNTISNIAATTLHIDEEGLVWIGTFTGGLNSFDPKTEKFTRYPLINPNKIVTNPFMENSVRDIVPDPQDKNKLWLATHIGIIHFDKKNGKVEQYRLEKNGQAAFSVKLTIDKNKLWVAAENLGLAEFSTINKTFQYHFEKNSINGVNIKSADELWVSTRSSGLAVFNKKNKKKKIITSNPNNPNSLMSDAIAGIYLDNKQRLWVRDLNEGVNITNGKRPLLKKPKAPAEVWKKLNGEKRFSYDKTSQQLYVISIVGTDFHIFQKEKEQYLFYKTIPLPIYDAGNLDGILDIETDMSGTTWVLLKTKQELKLFQYDKVKEVLTAVDFPALEKIKVATAGYASLASDQQNRLWIAFPNGMLLINGKDKSEHQLAKDQGDDHNPQIHKILFDSKNNLWACSYENGVYSYNIKSKEEKHFPYDESENGLDAWRILTLTEKKDGNMWVGTSALGIQELNPEDPPIQFMPTYDQNNGMPDNKIFGLETDRSGNIWVATLRGLVKYNPSITRFQQYGKKEGLENTFLKYGFHLANNDDLIIGLPVGFQYMFPNQAADAISPNEIRFSELWVNGKEYQPRQSLPF